MTDDTGKARAAAAGAANLQRWREAHPSGGNLRHGAFSKHFRKRYTDLRTTEGKALRAIIDELKADLGEVSAGQALILGQIRSKLVVLLQIGQYVDKQPSAITKKGELLGCLGRGYTAYSEALRRDIEMLYSLARKRPPRTPSLEDYLEKGPKL
jgi:hypothetical protein